MLFAIKQYPLSPVLVPSIHSIFCPGGKRIVTYTEAVSNQALICALLSPWSVAKLANGGVIKGINFGSGSCPVLASEPATFPPDAICIGLSLEVIIILICSSPCETCSGSPIHCLTCLSGFPYFYNNYCYPTCPGGTFASSLSTCSGISCFYLIIYNL